MSPRVPKAKLDILSLLAQGGFHSGEEIGKQLGISRAAVSKHIKVFKSGASRCSPFREKVTSSPSR